MSSQDEELDPEAVASLLKTVGIIALLVIAAFAAGGVFYTVDAGERAVVTRFGEVEKIAQPGPNFKIPFVDALHGYEVRTQAYTMSSSAGEGNKARRDDSIEALTQEGLNVNVDMTVRYHNDPAKVDHIYKNVAPTERAILERIVRPTAREAVRSCSAQYSVEGIYSEQRDDFSDCVRSNIAEDFTDKGLVLEAVQIRNIMLPEKVRTAIQNKQAAQEKIEQKRKELKIEELETKRKIIEARGISKSNRIIADSLSQEYLQWYFIQEGLEKGDPIYVPIGGNGLQMFKDVDKTDVGGDGGDGDTDYDINVTDETTTFNSTANNTSTAGS